MRRLPLFPLPTVLFPGAPMPLHIFEPRYRRMVAFCVEADNRFGLVYHDPDQDGPFSVEDARVGCIARIERFQPLPDGRSLILCHGEERFSVVDGVESGAMYNDALVETYRDEPESAVLLHARRAGTAVLMRRVAREVLRTDAESLDPGGEVSFTVMRMIRATPAWMQSMLEMRSETERLDVLDTVLRAVLTGRE